MDFHSLQTHHKIAVPGCYMVFFSKYLHLVTTFYSKITIVNHFCQMYVPGLDYFWSNKN